MHSRKFSWVVSLVLAAMFAFPHAAGRYRASIRLLVHVDIAVEKNFNKPPALQIYFDQGKGFKEQDSIRVVLPEGGIQKQVQAYLPVTQLSALRFDYLNGPGTVTLANLTITDPYGAPLASHFSSARFHLHQTQPLEEKDGTLIVRTAPDAQDPYLTVQFEPSLQATKQGRIGANLFFGIKVFFILAAVLELLFLVIGKSWINAWLASRQKTDAKQ